jgi:hypothetical protein
MARWSIIIYDNYRYNCYKILLKNLNAIFTILKYDLLEEMVFEPITCIHWSILKKRKYILYKNLIYFSPRRKV